MKYVKFIEFRKNLISIYKEISMCGITYEFVRDCELCE